MGSGRVKEGGAFGEWERIHAVISTACGVRRMVASGWRTAGREALGWHLWVGLERGRVRVQCGWSPWHRQATVLVFPTLTWWSSPYTAPWSLSSWLHFTGRNPQLREVKQNAWATELVSSRASVWTQVCLTLNPLDSYFGKQGLMGSSKTFCNLRQVNEVSGSLRSRCQNWFCL